MLQLIRAKARLIVPYWPWWALGVSASMLAAAHYFETFQNLLPCTLCLKQREVYWAAVTVAGAAIVASRTPWRERLRTPFNGLLAVIFLVGMGIAIWHVGAEWKWWPGPPTCASGDGGVSAGDLAAALGGAALSRPACDEAVWWFFGLSMAGWNVLISLKLAIWSAIAAVWKPNSVR